MNINERGNFVDIGFLYLMFLPLLFLFVIKKRNKILALFTFSLMLVLFIVATSNSFLFNSATQTYAQVKDGVIEQSFSADFSTAPVSYLVSKIYGISNTLFIPFEWIGNKITGDQDHFTYPFLVLLFILTGFLLFRELSEQKSNSTLTVTYLFFNYSFFWLVLSSGIIWYGFLMLCLGVVIILLLLNKLKEYDAFNYRWLNASFVTMTSIWIIMIFALRIGNITGGTPPAQYGTGLFHPVIYDFGSGVKSEKDVLDRMYPNFYATMETINREQNILIYRIGTGFTYFVKNNHKRVFSDNQLGFYNALAKRYPDKNELTDVLLASGFKYVILDLNTVTIDKTENRSLTKKYNSFLNYIFENPRVQVINTNRVVEITDPNTGQVNRYYGLFGKKIFNGSYAILRLK